MMFFFNDTATTEIYTLSLHDALPIWPAGGPRHPQREDQPQSRGPHRPARPGAGGRRPARGGRAQRGAPDRKSTRLNSSHANISYAVFCLKKKKVKAAA